MIHNRLLLLLGFIPFLTLGQLNESDTLNLKAKLALTGIYQGGNVETLIFRAKTDVSFRPWKKWVFKNQNSYVYQAFDKDKADEDFLTLNFLYLNPDRKIYPFALGIVSSNFRREIDLRFLTGGGVSFQVFNKNQNWLKLSLSSEYEQTRFSSTDFNIAQYDGDDYVKTLRGTLWVNGKYYFFKKKMILNHELYFQPSLIESDNFRWQGDIGVEFPIWKYINFKIDYRHTVESIVVQDQLEEDRFLTFGFTLKSF